MTKPAWTQRVIRNIKLGLLIILGSGAGEAPITLNMHKEQPLPKKKKFNGCSAHRYFSSTLSKGYHRASVMGEEIWESCTEEVPAFQVTVLLNCWTVESLTQHYKCGNTLIICISAQWIAC